MSDNLSQGRNVSMYPQDWAIVDEADKYDAGTSATLRMIVREWKQFKAERINILTDERPPYTVTAAK